MNVQAPRSPDARRQQGHARPGGAGTGNRSRAPRAAWLIVGLLFLFMLINFADKAVIGIAAVPLMTELR
jgi:MFS transporter, ACS family, D-galactonate transporter